MCAQAVQAFLYIIHVHCFSTIGALIRYGARSTALTPVFLSALTRSTIPETSSCLVDNFCYNLLLGPQPRVAMKPPGACTLLPSPGSLPLLPILILGVDTSASDETLLPQRLSFETQKLLRYGFVGDRAR